tara:strand:- start:38 stop:1354 length:1317 start_codon:yes stop_codon:yes gene_type:complete
MATLASTTDLSQYVGATVETVNNSMTSSTTVQGKFGKLGVRGGPDISSVIVKNTQSNLSNLNRFVSLASSNPTIAREIQLDVGYPNPITIKNINKPNVNFNMGDVAEGIFAAAIAARFINRGVDRVSINDVKNIIGSLSPLPIMGRKSQMAFYNTTAPNQGVQVRDGIKLTITLGAANMALLTSGRNLDNYARASLQYANKQSVTTWVNTLYTNKRADRIEIIGDGVSGQRSTKVDVKVKVTNDKGQLQPINIDVSLKAGEVSQFGQVGGIDIQNLSKFFSNIFGVQVDSFIAGIYQEKTISENDVEGGLNYLYEEVTKKLNNITPSIVQSIANGIKLYATGGDDNVELVQLSQGEATIYNFKDVGQKLAGLKYSATVTKSGSLPQITVSSNSKTLISIRSRRENKRDSQGRPYTYFRNYIEKGPLLGELIARAAKDE